MRRPIDYMNYCPQCGESAPEKQINHILCNACGAQLFLNVACGVAAFIKNNVGELLFMRRAKDPGKGMLDLVGGFVDAGEGVEEALLREVQEEAGMSINTLEYFASFPNVYTYNGVTYDVTDVFFIATSDDVPTQNDDETLGFEWIAIDDVTIEDIALPSIQQAVDAYKQQQQ